MNEEIQYERYQRQLILKGFGVEAQSKLKAARVLVIGAGGLGCPIMQYLVAAGVGHIGIADHDTVSVSNLHRQILFGQEDVGRPKVEVVKLKMNVLNQDAVIETWQEKWTPSLCLAQFPLFDIIVDATDNFASRYMINDACVLLGKPLVFGAVSQFEGQVAVFNHVLENGNHSVNYRDLFPEPPASGEVLNCAEGGVLGVLPGMIGAMQATEVIKLITGLGKPLVNRLWNYNALLFSPLFLLLPFLKKEGLRKMSLLSVALLFVYVVIMVNKPHLPIMLPFIVSTSYMLLKIIGVNPLRLLSPVK